MRDESVFRIVAVRGADAPAIVPLARQPLDYQANPNTGFQKRIAAALAATGGAAEAKRIAAEFRGSAGYVSRLSALKFPVSALLDWASKHRNDAVNSLDFNGAAQAAGGAQLAALVATPEFKAAFDSLSDTVCADAVLANPGPAGQPAIAAVKLFELLRRASTQGGKLNQDTRLAGVLDSMIVIAPAPLRQDLGQPSAPPVEPDRPTIRVPDRVALQSQLDQLLDARKDLANTIRLKGSLRVSTVATQLAEGATRQAELLNLQSSAIKNAAKTVVGINTSIAEIGAQRLLRAAITATPSGDHILGGSASATLSAGAVQQLKGATTETLGALGLKTDALGPVRAVGTLDRQIQLVSGQMTAPESSRPMVAFAGGHLNRDLLISRFGFDKFAPLLPGLLEKCEYAVGVADLLIVRQKLKAYEVGDFAHVENALKGELRLREHRRLDLTEDTTAVTTETAIEKERNQQSTERNEMQSEASKQVKSQAGVDAGLTVSGSYGPTVSFSASLNAHFSTSTDETQRKTTSFSREVTEKTSEKVTQRVQEQKTRRVLEQVEELNRHSIDNSVNPTGHVRGVYRWLNKVYDAQVFNYGKRMMYEFVLPEPAAFLIYSLIDHPPADTDLPPKPEPPDYFGSPLKPENLQIANYQAYVAKYGVTGAPTPPSEFVFSSYFDKLESADNVQMGRSAKLPIPDGYEAFGAFVHTYHSWKGDDPSTLKITLGGANLDASGFWGASWVDFSEAFRGEMSVTYGGIRLTTFGLGVDVYCSLTAEGFAKWQQAAYDAILHGYEKLRGNYEEKLNASKIAQGVKIIGRNPLENQRTIQNELKKLVIMVLRGNPYLNINSFLNSTEPAMSISKTCSNGKLIRFFENAFEWANMSFVVYPYFWGRHARWNAALQFTDPDPDFAGFLQAGAARVQVPVRPGFEKAVAYFSDTGQIWDGGDPPMIGDSTYLPIVQEITESLGKLDDGVPYPEGSKPWEVIVPTTLIVLQDLDEISAIRDAMTGQPLKLLPPPAQ